MIGMLFLTSTVCIVLAIKLYFLTEKVQLYKDMQKLDKQIISNLENQLETQRKIDKINENLIRQYKTGYNLVMDAYKYQ